MRPAVGARGSFALSGVIEFAGFTSFSSRPGSSPGGRTISRDPVTGHTKRMMVSTRYLPIAGSLRAPPSRLHPPEAPEGFAPVRFYFLF